MNKISLSAYPRQIRGRGVASLRKLGLIPAVVYGKGFDSVAVQISQKEFNEAYLSAGESTLVYLMFGDRELPTVIHGIAEDPLTADVIHADFYKVNLKEKIKTHVTIRYAGESPAVKNLGGVLVKNLGEIEVEALPQNMPHEIEVNLGDLSDMGAHITVGDLILPKDVKVENNPDDIVVLVQEPRQEEIVAEAPSVEDVEVIEKKQEPEVSDAQETAKE